MGILLSSCAAAAYRHAAKPFFFRRDPEDVHDRVLALGEALGKHGATRALTRCAFAYRDPLLELTVDGVHYRNPVGLAAGFDKDARLTGILPHVGFGFEEIGSVTGEPCAGNPRPRLWRLPKSKALAVWYGLKNDGAEAVSARMRGRTFAFPVGISIAKTNCAETCDRDAGISDYEKAMDAFSGIGQYVTVNISCPNTFGGQPFTDPESLDALLAALLRKPAGKPVYLKLSADLIGAQLDAVLDVGMRHGISGFICSNLTKDRAVADLHPGDAVPDKGGLSGGAVRRRSDEQLRQAYARVGGKATLIGVGGVFSAEDAYAKIRSGASLVQLVTGLIFEGPQLIGQINRGLARLLRRDGFAGVLEARGVDVRA